MIPEIVNAIKIKYWWSVILAVKLVEEINDQIIQVISQAKHMHKIALWSIK